MLISRFFRISSVIPVFETGFLKTLIPGKDKPYNYQVPVKVLKKETQFSTDKNCNFYDLIIRMVCKLKRELVFTIKTDSTLFC